MAISKGNTTPKKFNFNKKVLVHTGAAVAGALLIIFGISQCSNKRNERAAKDAALRNAAQKEAQVIEASKTLERAAIAIDSLLTDNGIKADSIVVLNDSIQVLNDSLDLTKSQLADCRKSKCKAPKKSAGNAPVNESRSAQPRVIDTVVVAPVANNETVINLRDSSKNTGNVIVANDNAAGGNRTEISLGNGTENSGTIVVNNGGNITIYDKDQTAVLPSAAIDTLQKQANVDTLRAKVVCVWAEKKRNWVR